MPRFTPLTIVVLTGLVPLLAACDAREASAAGGAPGSALAPDADPLAASPDVLARLQIARGDLPQLLAARRVRVLTPYAPPFFFFRGAEPRGITYEVFREFGAFLEEREGLRAGDLKIVYVPCEPGATLAWLEGGYGDIAAGALKVTPEREERVAFTDALDQGVAEIVVTSANAAPLASLDDLAGREVWVPAGSSYAERLRASSARLEREGRAPIRLVEAPGTLGTEDLLEMVHAGIVELTVCDDYRVELWAELLDGLRPRADLVLHEGGRIAWAVRKDNPELRACLDEFVARAKRGTLLGNVLIKRYFGSTRWIENPLDDEHRARLTRYEGWLRGLGDEYGFDWLRLAAQCFQESGLDPDARSGAGAVGLMQLLPATAKDMGCDDPTDPEQNLRAGVRYLAWLREHFFDQPELGEVERMDLILAAYNAGPGNVRKWRKQAAERGLDPNRWRENVERLALEAVGVEPLRYVDNVEKYYLAYTLSRRLAEDRAQALEAAAPGR